MHWADIRQDLLMMDHGESVYFGAKPWPTDIVATYYNVGVMSWWDVTIEGEKSRQDLEGAVEIIHKAIERKARA